MSIAGDLIRGHTDAIILARLLRSDSYGYEINKSISTLSSGRFELKEATNDWKMQVTLPPTGVIPVPVPVVGIIPSPPRARMPVTVWYGNGKKPKKLWINF